MHARKLPRISEPSFDKDYYDNNGRGYSSRYNSSSSSASTMQSTSRGRSSSGYSNENRMYRRCDSPSNRSQSPRDRMGGSSTGMSRNRDMMRRGIDSDGYGKSTRRDQRVRERSLVHRSGSHDRSPKDKWDSRNSSRIDRELSTPSCLGRSEPKVKSVGDWSEHVSSSGKKYYYNSVTELSQWDKPRVWLEYERTRFSNNNKSQPHSEVRRHIQQHRGQPASRPQPTARSNNSSSSYLEESRSRISSQNISAQEVNNGSFSCHQSTSSSYYSYGKPSATVVSSSEAMEVASGSSLSPPESLESDGHQYQESTSNNLSENQQQPMTGESSSAVDQMGSYSPSDPPTPTQSEQENPSEVMAISSTTGTTSSVTLSSNSVTSLSASLSQVTPQRPQMASLTPSLSKLYRDTLIGHVTGWPAEAVERACLRINDEHQMSNLCVTRVSAELKMARSLVRLAEIQATLQEQRILFLRQESYDLEMMSNRGGSGQQQQQQQLLSGDDTVLSATALNSPSAAAKANFWPNVSASTTSDA